MRDLEDVDKVLAGLGAVKPGAGMEARILLALAQPELRDRRLSHGKFWPWLFRWPLVTAFLLAVLLVLAPVATYILRRGTTRPAPGMLASSRGMSPASQRPPVPRAVEPLVDAGTPNVLNVRSTRSGQERARKARAVPPPAMTAQDARAESFPAPPMPLTRQERLLLRMLRGGETGELVAALTPEAETAVRSAESAEFRAFFRPVPVVADSVHGAEKPLPDTGLDGSPVVVAPKVLLGDSGGEK